MTKHDMLQIVQSQLATDLNCAPDDLNGVKDSFVFKEASDNPGRRPFPRGERHFEILSMGSSIVISASPDILKIAMSELSGKSRDEAFSMPFIYGHALYYLPDLDLIAPLSSPDEFSYELVEQGNIPALYQYTGFRSAIQYSSDCPRPDVLVTLAKKDGRIIGMAGASNDCAKMWQVGMDVIPEYRVGDPAFERFCLRQLARQDKAVQAGLIDHRQVLLSSKGVTFRYTLVLGVHMVDYRFS